MILAPMKRDNNRRGIIRKKGKKLKKIFDNNQPIYIYLTYLTKLLLRVYA
jgi:hypothetical protein